MRPVRLAPWAAGASPTTTMRAAGSPNPGTGRPQYSSSANAARFSVATCSRHCTKRGQRRHSAIDSARPASSSALIQLRTDRLRRGLSLAKRLRKKVRDPVCVDGAICGAVARAARREAARAGNRSTSVETTGHLSVPAARRISVEYDALFDHSIHPISRVAAARWTSTTSSTLIAQVCSHGRR